MGRSGGKKKLNSSTPSTRQMLLGGGAVIQSPEKNDPLLDLKDLKRATIDDLSIFWRKITKRSIWRKIPISDDVRDGWIARFIHRQNQGLPVLFPGTYVTLPSDNASQDDPLLEAFSSLHSYDPDSFDQFFREEIIPGIRGSVPPLLRTVDQHGLFWGSVLTEKFPDCSQAFLGMEDKKIFDDREVPRYMFFWNTIAAISKGMDPVEASSYSARITICDKLKDFSALRRMQYKLQKDSQRFQSLGLSPDTCSDKELWDSLKGVFDDSNNSTWLSFARGEVSLESIFCDFIEKTS
jgi:hypothetical protein